MMIAQEVTSSPSPSSPPMMNELEKHANDPLQVLATQSSKRVSFDEENLRKGALQITQQEQEAEENVVVKKNSATQERTAVIEEQQTHNPANASIHGEDMGESNCNSNEEGNSEGVYTPKEQDILSGRGAGVNLHPGNVFFRKLIQSNKKRYVQADPGEKKRIIRRIVEATEAKGRFLKQDPKTELWTRISTEEARKKTGQALRENAPAIKREQDELKKKKYEISALSALPSILSHGNRHQLEELNALSSSLSSPSLVSPPSCDSIEARLEEARFFQVKQLQRQHQKQLEEQQQQQQQRQQQILHSSNPNHMLLWTRMNILQEKQEQLKRKQRELEDEQGQLMQYMYQMSAVAAATGTNSTIVNAIAPATTPATTRHIATSSHMNRSSHAMNMNGLFSVNSSDSDSDSICGRIAKKRRLIVH